MRGLLSILCSMASTLYGRSEWFATTVTWMQSQPKFYIKDVCLHWRLKASRNRAWTAVGATYAILNWQQSKWDSRDCLRLFLFHFFFFLCYGFMLSILHLFCDVVWGEHTVQHFRRALNLKGKASKRYMGHSKIIIPCISLVWTLATLNHLL